VRVSGLVGQEEVGSRGLLGSSSGTTSLFTSDEFTSVLLYCPLSSPRFFSNIPRHFRGWGRGGEDSTAAILLFGLELWFEWLILSVALRGAVEWMMDGLGLARVDDDFVFFLLLGQVEKERLPVFEVACIAEDENVGHGQHASISFRISRFG
jgi:hypothetical protein